MDILGALVCLITVMAFSVLALLCKLLFNPICQFAYDVIEIVDLIHKRIDYNKKIKERHYIIKQQFVEEMKKIAA